MLLDEETVFTSLGLPIPDQWDLWCIMLSFLSIGSAFSASHHAYSARFSA